jgi:hypothetical protein
MEASKAQCQGCGEIKEKTLYKVYATFKRYKDEHGKNWYGSYCSKCRRREDRAKVSWRYYVICTEIDGIRMFYCGDKLGLRDEVKKARKYHRTDKARGAINRLYPNMGFEILKVIKE